MASQAKSRWANEEEDALLDQERKREKEEKKRLKARRAEEAAAAAATAAQRQRDEAAKAAASQASEDSPSRPPKRRKLSPRAQDDGNSLDRAPIKLLRFPAPEWGPCRHVDNFEKLNHIEEGSYGWVSRALETATREVVALKKLKMENASDGFPVLGLREIQTLMGARHQNIVKLKEVVVGDTMDEYDALPLFLLSLFILFTAYCCIYVVEDRLT